MNQKILGKQPPVKSQKDSRIVQPEQAYPSGTAMCPNERGVGLATTPRGTNEHDLREWCAEHQL